MSKKQIYTNEYPIRYAAQENQGVIVENEVVKNNSFECDGGGELFYYYKTFDYKGENPFNNYGYVVVSICSYQKKAFIVKLEAEYPDRMRKMKVNHEILENYQDARKKALQYVEEAEKWIESDWWKEIPETIVTEARWKSLPEWLKMIMPDGTKVVRLVGDGRKYAFNVDFNKYQNEEYFRVEIAQEEHVFRWNEREYYDNLMKKEGKSVEILEKMGMKFMNFDIIIKYLKDSKGNWYWRIFEPTGQYNHLDKLPSNCKVEFLKWENELLVKTA